MKINKEGFFIITCFVLFTAAAITCSAIWLWPWITWILAAILLFLTGFVIYFFRDPARETLTSTDGLVYAPADGEVVVIEQVEEKEYLNEKCLQISIFMALTSVHVNWFPVAGRVVYFRHHPGKYLVAWHPKSSEQNERTTTVVDTGKHKVLFRQVAGYMARRIVSYAKEGVDVPQNSRAGFIKFGSRIDIFLPLSSEVLVLIGDKMTGSQTPIARLK